MYASNRMIFLKWTVVQLNHFKPDCYDELPSFFAGTGSCDWEILLSIIEFNLFNPSLIAATSWILHALWNASISSMNCWREDMLNKWYSTLVDAPIFSIKTILFTVDYISNFNRQLEMNYSYVDK